MTKQSQTNKNMGLKMIRPKKEQMKSKKGLIRFLYINIMNLIYENNINSDALKTLSIQQVFFL